MMIEKVLYIIVSAFVIFIILAMIFRMMSPGRVRDMREQNALLITLTKWIQEHASGSDSFLELKQIQADLSAKTTFAVRLSEHQVRLVAPIIDYAIERLMYQVSDSEGHYTLSGLISFKQRMKVGGLWPLHD